MRRVVATPRSSFRLRRTAATLLVTAAIGGCANQANSGGPTTEPSTPEVVSITETELSGDQLIRVTGTVVETDAPGCLLLDTGTSTYLLIGGDPDVVEPDAEITVTGNANPQTPTPCPGGTPLTVTEAVPVE